MRRDPVVANAAGSFREGLLFTDEHPSWAIVAFMAAIDGIGLKLNKPVRCRECTQVTEATSRFQQAADLVKRPEEGDTDTLKRCIKRRGATAHQGELHGNESLLGAFARPSAFTLDPGMQAARDVYALRRMARALLLHALKGYDLRSIAA